MSLPCGKIKHQREVKQPQEVFMGFFSDLFFGTSSLDSSNSNQRKKKNDNFYAGPFDNDYDNYYGALYDEAMAGDQSAIMEMEEEFGEDWEGEY